MARGEKLIFVGGAARSGTTLLQNVLDSHPLILGGPQFGNIPDIINLREKLYYRIKIGKTDAYNSYADIDNHICTLIENLLLPLLKKQGGELLSEKTPPNIKVFPELLELFPGAHFINIIRDPRAVVLSLLLIRERFKEQGVKIQYSGSKLSDFIGLTSEVKQRVLAGLSAAKLAPTKVLTVVYERLVTDPENETKKICNYLGIEWSSDMLYPSRKQHLAENSMTQQGIWYTKKSYNRDFDPTCINKWEEQLTLLQKALVSYYFRDIEKLAHYGYDFSSHNYKEKALIAMISFLKRTINDKKILRNIMRPIMNLKTFTKYNETTHVS